MSENIKPARKYSFTQMTTALTAFVANFEKNIQIINEDIPVFIMNAGDSSYFFDKKFSKIDNKEIYLKVPRIIIKIEDSQPQIDQNTNQYIKMKYVFNDKLYTGNFRRQTMLVPVSIKIVTSNFVKGLEYYEMLAAIMSIDNVFTYEFLGNTYEANYNGISYSFEEGAIDASSTSRNFVVSINCELHLQVFLPRYKTLEEIDAFQTDEERYGININIVTKNPRRKKDDQDDDNDYVLGDNSDNVTDLSGSKCKVCDGENCEIHPEN